MATLRRVVQCGGAVYTGPLQCYTKISLAVCQGTSGLGKSPHRWGLVGMNAQKSGTVHQHLRLRKPWQPAWDSPHFC